MKKLHVLIATFFIVFLSACSKDELNANATKIVGTWKVEYTKVTFDGETDTQMNEDELTIKFHANGKVEASFYETFEEDDKEVKRLVSSSGTYSISPNGKVLTMKEEGDNTEGTQNIVELTDTSLVLTSNHNSQETAETHLKKIK